jgi:glycosyltransferase involved in cell wall biosynthesis
MKLEDITPLLLTFNEQENIDRVLKKLQWAKRIIVVDSFSSDNTLEIIKRYANVIVLQRPFDNFADQCNYGLGQVSTQWVLSLDADYVLSDSFINEVQQLSTENEVGYQMAFKYCVFGHPLSSSVLPPRTVLYMKEHAKYIEDGHAHRVKLEGLVGRLKSRIFHDDRKTLSRWLKSQDNYMPLEVKKIFSGVPLSFTDNLRKMIFIAPLLMFFYCLFVKRGILDGKRGWYYAYQRLLAECLLSLRILEYHLNKESSV